jgi:uncharacterized protein YggE
MSKKPILTVRGSAQLSAAPDLVTIWWASRVESDTAETVRNEVATNLSSADSILAAIGPAIHRIARRVNISPRIHQQQDQPRTEGYVGEGSMTIELTDFEQLNELVTKLMQIPGASISGPNWSLQPDNAVFTQARLEAIADAKRIARDYANAFDAEIKSLVEVIDDSGHPMPHRIAMRVGGPNGEGAEINLQPEEQEAQSSVTVRFRIEKPTRAAASGAN